MRARAAASGLGMPILGERVDLRELVGFVSQEPIVFSGTIGDNIRYGRPEASPPSPTTTTVPTAPAGGGQPAPGAPPASLPGPAPAPALPPGAPAPPPAAAPAGGGPGGEDAGLTLEETAEVLGLTPASRRHLDQGQFDALVSFTFNLGAGAYQRSTLRQCVLAGHDDLVPDQLMRWVRAGGRTLAGLVRRRQAEAMLYRPV